MIERCRDRQRKCDGLKRWPLESFIEGLRVILQVALLLLTCGLSRYMWSINASVAYILIGFTGLGVASFIVVMIVGTFSYACPFQTLASAALRGLWEKIRGKRTLSRIRRTPKQRIRPLPRCPLLPVAISLGNAQAKESEPWLRPANRQSNADDVRCVSWILRDIIDPEALDAAIRRAGTIRWFEDGLDPSDVPYDSIVSTFEACFDSTGKLYHGSRDRAYYSGRAMVWINTLARRKHGAFVDRFILPLAKHEGPSLDPDLRHLLRINQGIPQKDWSIARLFSIDPEHTPSHVQWVSDVLFHHFWTAGFQPTDGDVLDWISDARETKIDIPPNAILNRLLVWCVIFGSRPAEEALMVQNKSYGTSCFALQITYSTLH